VFYGFIFINLCDEEPVDFDASFADLAPYLDFHGFADAKITYTQSYPTTANWKLVVENFVECYHCASAHPEFCSMHPPEALLAFGAGPSSGPTDAVEKVSAHGGKLGSSARLRSAARLARSMMVRSPPICGCSCSARFATGTKLKHRMAGPLRR